jgi:hypothetical protein
MQGWIAGPGLPAEGSSFFLLQLAFVLFTSILDGLHGCLLALGRASFDLPKPNWPLRSPKGICSDDRLSILFGYP